jgi:hypothetical protein
MTKEIKQWLSDYDKDNEMETVSMGGISDGYEAAIQDCAIEIMRGLPEDVPDDIEEFHMAIKKAQDHAVKILNNFHGFSGAQVGAASNMASVFWRRTPKVGIEIMQKSDPDRIIKIKKDTNGHPIICNPKPAQP